MYRVQVFNNISREGLDRFPEQRYQVGPDVEDPHVILLRSHSLHGLQPGPSLRAVGRAGAGVNNIPVEHLGRLGIAVFNTPGANANAVKELVVAGLLVACRNLMPAWRYAQGLSGSDEAVEAAVETGKKQFAGSELPGRTIGIIGLGAVGRSVAAICLQLGMKVIGYDPMLTVEGAWALASEVARARSVQQLLAAAEFVTFHVPLTDSTREMINADTLRMMKTGATLLNFARAGIVDDQAARAALEAGRLRAYVTDFPNSTLLGCPGVILFPHLGASTAEAEENCARMVVDQVRDFLENGNVRNSVNFPEVILPRGSPYRIVVANANVPNMLGQISTAMAEAGLNIHDMINQSRGSLAFTVADSDSPIPEEVVTRICAIEGVLSARLV